MKTTTRQEAIEELFGKAHPDRRFQARNILQSLGRKYPDLMQEVADHAAGRVEEAGDSISVGRLQTIRIEAETLGLRQCLLDGAIRDGLMNSEGKPHEALSTVMKLTDQALRTLLALGLTPPKQVAKPTEHTTALDAWNRALQASGTSSTSTSAPKDNAEQVAVYEGEEGIGDEQ